MAHAGISLLEVLFLFFLKPYLNRIKLYDKWRIGFWSRPLKPRM